jgi:hypothetical protein
MCFLFFGAALSLLFITMPWHAVKKLECWLDYMPLLSNSIATGCGWFKSSCKTEFDRRIV